MQANGNLEITRHYLYHVAKGNNLADNFHIFFILRPSLQPWRIPLFKLLSTAGSIGLSQGLSWSPQAPNYQAFMGLAHGKHSVRKNYYGPVDESWRPLNGSRYYRYQGPLPEQH
jgi:hypothetical protein